MIKLVALVRKKSGMTREAFRDYWVGTHAPLAAAIPGMRGYRINVAGDPGDLESAEYDGSAEIWFDNRAAMEAGLASTQGVIAGDDTAHFTESIEFLVTEEHVILPREGAG
ncbi:EthD family reductase [Aestuariibius sp. 2305UL40-4]|uniref:EthD family reductase n=1 Tax=Aestuariibius violaceus TaxID=3234132 RepID=UPI00345F04D2